MKKIKVSLIVLLGTAIIVSSCKSLNKTQKGAAIGTASGAAVGGVIGKASGNTALGAIIGAVVGGGAGAIIGHKMDKQAEEIKKEVPDAKVERVGEGIEVVFNSNVLFAVNQSSITPQADNILHDLVKILAKYPDTNIEIQGHTDNTGTNEYNQTLSMQRGQAVADHLINVHGVSASRITSKGFGETAPKYTNDTEEGRSQNRRVEFLITANDKMKADAAKEAGTPGN